MKRRIAILGAVVVLVLGAMALPAFAAGKSAPKATGGIWMSGPNQQMKFDAHDGTTDKGTVEYWNYDYPGLLHYTANVLCADVDQGSGEAWFTFQIPGGWPGLSGLYVEVHVTDGGTPGTNGDVYGHTVVAQAEALSCSAHPPVTNYPIVGGNLVVH